MSIHIPLTHPPGERRGHSETQPDSAAPTRSQAKPIGVVVADEDEGSRALLERILGGWPAVEILAATADGFEALKLVGTQQPDLVLLNLHMSGLDGLLATSLIQEFRSATRVVLLTEDDSEQLKENCLTQGADGLVLKRNLRCELHRTLGDLFPDIDLRQSPRAKAW